MDWLQLAEAGVRSGGVRHFLPAWSHLCDARGRLLVQPVRLLLVRARNVLCCASGVLRLDVVQPGNLAKFCRQGEGLDWEEHRRLADGELAVRLPEPAVAAPGPVLPQVGPHGRRRVQGIPGGDRLPSWLERPTRLGSRAPANPGVHSGGSEALARAAQGGGRWNPRREGPGAGAGERREPRRCPGPRGRRLGRVGAARGRRQRGQLAPRRALSKAA
mmetsp:Transcript_81740/g.257808  ORF Transcript_81740/g.257808 Transcript_81740/m.257808 type:complete len:217 (-) Transcript_81740:142-792(-)